MTCKRMTLLTYQGAHATSRTVFVHNPELRMDLERIEDYIDVLGVAIFELLQDLDLMHSDLDGFILC